jgi:hypothetical protein
MEFNIKDVTLEVIPFTTIAIPCSGIISITHNVKTLPHSNSCGTPNYHKQSSSDQLMAVLPLHIRWW